ncbi:MAG TPA: phosphotransferase family protein [Candidatus Angelobacter sp.]|jgi:aminoglycoside phosphotransferase (APT) family kinase protein|nr:phosphotransferase family protein [Candidatus Angelobacter sp.]
MTTESAKRDLVQRHDFQDHAAAVRPGEELDWSKLESYLCGHLPDASGPLEVQQFPSGHSNLTYFISLARAGEKLELVLRRPPFGSKVKSAHDMGREYRVLSRLCSVYPAPRPLLYCDDTSIIGAPFYLMERLRGIILRRDLPAGLDINPDTARKLDESFVDNLVRLHALDYNAIGLADLGKPDGYVERQVSGWIDRYHKSKTHELPEVEQVAGWLKRHLPPACPATVIHNDYKFDNMILDSGDITQIKGVLDWEMCTLGDPLSDLGTALGYWVDPHDPPELQAIHWGPTMIPGSLTRKQLVNRYAQQTGRDASNMVFYYVFALFKTAVVVQQIYYRYHHGLTNDQRFASLMDVAHVLLRAAIRAIDGNEI